jgi:hypothetical protein
MLRPSADKRLGLLRLGVGKILLLNFRHSAETRLAHTTAQARLVSCKALGAVLRIYSLRDRRIGRDDWWEPVFRWGSGEHSTYQKGGGVSFASVTEF